MHVSYVEGPTPQLPVTNTDSPSLGVGAETGRSDEGAESEV